MGKTIGESGERVSVSQPLGRAVRALRRERGMTLARLSEQSGLSIPFLSQVENNRSSPSLQSLSAIAAALGANTVDIMRAAEADCVVDVEPASVDAPDRSLGRLQGQIEVLELTRPDGEGQDWQVHLYPVVLYVVRGRVVVTVSQFGDDTDYALGAGGRMTCGSGVAYRWHADGGEAVLIAVLGNDRATLSRQ